MKWLKKRLKNRRNRQLLYDVLLLCCVIGIGSWYSWFRANVYRVVCDPQPCAEELAVQARLRKYVGDPEVHFINFPATRPPRKYPDEGCTYNHSVHVYRPVFTADFQRVAVMIVRGECNSYTTSQLKLIKHNNTWELDGREIPLVRTEGFP